MTKKALFDKNDPQYKVRISNLRKMHKMYLDNDLPAAARRVAARLEELGESLEENSLDQ